MTQATKDMLAPCPFCGGTEIFVRPDEVGSGGQHVSPYHVGCSLQKGGCGVSVQDDERADAITRWNTRAAYTEAVRAQAAPVGWKLIPIEPNLEMMTTWHKAYDKAQWNENSWNSAFAVAYAAMLEAAPPPPGITPSIDKEGKE